MSNSEGSGCGKFFGYGCLTIFLLVVLVPLLATNGAVGLIAVAMIITLIVVAVRSGKKSAHGAAGSISPQPKPPASASSPASAGAQRAQISDYNYSPGAPRVEPKPENSSETGQAPAMAARPATSRTSRGLVNPVCDHIFTRTEVIANSYVTCACGNTFASGDLLEFDRLNDVLITTEAKLTALEKKMIALAKDEAPVEQVSAASATVVKPIPENAQATVAYQPRITGESVGEYQPAPRVAKPKAPKIQKPKVQRPKVSLSLQQWLFIGASLLVVVAGSVFVSTYRGHWSSQQFLIFTTVVAAATGFGGFKTRKISAILSNFLAVFSSAMQLASLAIIGDIFNPFTWDHMPAWYWTISLILITIFSGVLARFSRNFGWKVIAMLSISSAAGVWQIGVMRTVIGGSASLIHLTIGMVFAAGILATNRYIRSIPHPEAQSPEFEEYEQMLAKLTDNGLFQFGRISAALQLVISAGLVLFNITTLFNQPFAPWSTLVLAAVWVAIGVSAKYWGGQLDAANKQPTALAKATPAVVSISLGLTLVGSTYPLTGGLLWLNVVLSILGLGALVFLSTVTRWIKPNLNQVTAMVATSAAAWLIWNGSLTTATGNPGALAGFLMGVGLVLNLVDYLFEATRFEWAGSALNGIAMVLYLSNIISNNQARPGSIGYALLVLLLILLANLQSPIRWAMRKRTGSRGRSVNGQIALGVSGVLSIWSLTSIHGATDLRPMGFVFLAYPAVALALTIWGPLKERSGLLNGHAYVGHLIPLAAVFYSISASGNRDAGVNALMIGVLAVINYGFGALRKQALRMQIGFVSALVAFWIAQFAVTTGSLALILTLQSLLVLAAGLAHSWLLNKRAGVTGLDQNLASMIAVGGSLLLGRFAQTDLWWPDGAKLQLLIVLGLLTAAAVALARLGETRLFAGAASLLRVAALSYAFANVISDINDYKRVLIAIILASAALRLRNREFKGRFENGLFFVLNLEAGYLAGENTRQLLAHFRGPESITLWLAVALVVSVWLSRVELGSWRRILAVDVPVLGVALSSLSFALTDPDVATSVTRGVISLALIAAYSYYRSKSAQPYLWLAAGYVTGVTALTWLVGGIYQLQTTYPDLLEAYSVAAGVGVFVGNYFLKKRSGKDFTDLRLVLLFGTLTLPSLFVGVTSGLSPVENAWRAIASLLVIAGLAYRRTAKTGAFGWIVAAYFSAVAESMVLAHLVSTSLIKDYSGPEIYSVLAVASLLLTHRVALKHLQVKGTLFAWDLPVAVATLPSVFYALSGMLATTADQWRLVLALLAITALCYYRVAKGGSRGWIVGAYLTAAAESLAIAHLISLHLIKDFNGPETYSLLAAGSVIATHSVALKHLDVKGSIFKWDLPIGIVAVPTLLYSLAAQLQTAADQWRLVLALLIITALTFYRTKTNGHAGWAAGAYVVALAESQALGYLVSSHLIKGYQGPEIYSLLAGAAVFATHSVALKQLKLENTLLSWGLPTAVLLVPSIIYTYWSLDLPFEKLDGLQIARMLITLTASIALLVLGVRLGNLANATMGLVGLALVVLPNISMHTSTFTASSQVETTSLVLGMLVFLGLWLFGKYGKLTGNSRLFIGVPVAIALAPSLVRSLIALANPDLTPVDWWRFSIILAASMTLLIIGSLRELAGMFYPGLISLLLSALPYGFKQSTSTGWLLWVMLLLVAGVMVWLAVRLERLKKAGRSSGAWLKELK